MLHMPGLPGTDREARPVNLPETNWTVMSSILAIGGTLGVLIYMVLRARLANDFVTRREYNDAMARLEKTEEAIKAVPSREDIGALRSQMAGVSERVAVVGASLDGLKSGMGRIEHQLDLMMTAQLERETKS